MYNEEIKVVFIRFAKQDIGFSDGSIDAIEKVLRVTSEVETSLSKDISKFTESEVKILLEMIKSYQMEAIKRFFMVLETYYIWYWCDFVSSGMKDINPFTEEVVKPLINKLSFN